MTKGIRQYVNDRFAKHLAKFTENGDGKVFRRKVMEDAQKKFGVTVASAATHYNFALKTQRMTDPKSVEGLGREEGKKGGRPVQNPVNVVNARSKKVVKGGEGISMQAARDMLKAQELKGSGAKLEIETA